MISFSVHLACLLQNLLPLGVKPMFTEMLIPLVMLSLPHILRFFFVCEEEENKREREKEKERERDYKFIQKHSRGLNRVPARTFIFACLNQLIYRCHSISYDSDSQ